MPARDRAEYMREYRKRQRALILNVPPHMHSDNTSVDEPRVGPPELTALQHENERLAEEVARLKRLLAERPGNVVRRERSQPVTILGAGVDYGFAQFRPAPKPGKHR